jgi:hypothetical protein
MLKSGGKSTSKRQKPMLNLELDFGTEPKKLYRRVDPDTSRDSAHSVDTQNMERIVLDAISRFPNGCTADEVVESLGMRWNSVTPRFSALMRKGYIVDTGERKVGQSGRKQRIIKAVK